MKDSISFIIASYNDDELISDTLDSILEQRLEIDEIIVVDGLSTDNTVGSARERLDNKKNTTIISEPDTGIYDAWNKAIKICRSEWVVFLGCGDIIKAEYRQEMSLAIKTCSSSTNLIHHRAQFYTIENGRFKKGHAVGGVLDKNRFINLMGICHVGALHHRNLFSDLVYSTEYKCVSDYHFLLKHLPNIKSVFINKVLVSMEATGISSRHTFTFYEELKMKRDLGSYNHSFLWFSFLSKVLKTSLIKCYRRLVI